MRRLASVRPARRPAALRPALALCGCALLALPTCSGSSGGGRGPGQGQRTFRAIAGVSMGAYGALNLGTRRRDLFGTIGSLGGPVDLWQLLADIRDENLEVKVTAGFPMDVGDDFTFDKLPPYPDRQTRIGFTKDLVLAFGNPLLHHPDPDFAYLASDSQPAALRMDDEWGAFTIPADPRGFSDGGDANENGLREVGEAPDEPSDALLVAGGSLAGVLGIGGGVDVGGRMLADDDTDGIYDIGDGIVVNLGEPFTDANGNGVFDPGEAFGDLGLDGVSGTLDFGEGNGVFDEDPDVATWLLEDPLTRIAALTADEIREQRIYMDVGDGDELGFGLHYGNLVGVLTGKGIPVTIVNGYDGNCFTVPDVDDPYTLLIYQGGHVGFDTADLLDDLRNADVCGASAIWQRLIHLLVALEAAFPDGFYGPGGPRPGGSTDTHAIASPALAVGAGPAPLRTVVVYTPPAFHNTGLNLPIVYFLGGHGQKPEDYERIGVLLDFLIGARVIQNMIMAFLPGEGGTEGSFYVNHAVSEAQVPGLAPVTSGRYADSILEDLIPALEQTILGNRVR